MEISGKSQEALQVVVANLRSSQIQIDSLCLQALKIYRHKYSLGTYLTTF